MASRSLGQGFLVGSDLGHYRIVEKIGAGGMGEVYRARDEHLARDVAVKVLSPGTLTDASARNHFHREALALSKLNYPSVATIYDFDTQQGVDFLVMEYIPGTTLSEKVAAGPLPEKEVLRLGVQLAEGLAAAHDHGVVHRDLKPGNLRVTSDGRLKILDFGLAKLRPLVTDSAATESLSETQTIAGTLPYMAPDQLLGGQMDARTDIWAAGCVLYEMATGRRPFPGSGPTLTDAILHGPFAPPSALNPRVSAGLTAIIFKCLEKEPDNRYQSAKELAVDLRRMGRDGESGHIAAEAQPLTPQRSSFARHWKPIAASAGVVTVLLVVAAFWLARTKKAPATARITPSIAVLPFVDLSPEKDQEYFSDGLAEELLNSLVKMQGLHVAARTSSFQFKGKSEDLRVIGQKLNVATILEGSVRKQGQRVRISAQLIQTSDGFHLWSEAYDRDLTDIFAVQEEIASSVARSLKVTLLGEKAPSPRGTSVEAYNAYLQGKYFDGQYFSGRPDYGEILEKAIAYYEQAIKLDPNYASAWAALSRALWTLSDADPDPLRREGEMSKAREAAERALTLDPSLVDAYLAMGEIKQNYDWDWAGADAYYQRALALEPGNAAVVGSAASLAATLNRFEEALRLSRRAVELDPLQARTQFMLASRAWWAGRLDEAAAAGQKASELNPGLLHLHAVLGWVYLARSRPQEALMEAERETSQVFRPQGRALAYHALARKQESDRALAELIVTGQVNSAFQIAEVYAFRGEADAAFTWLERAYIQHDSGLTEMKGNPFLKNLEHDPRYAAFLKKMRLPA